MDQGGEERNFLYTEVDVSTEEINRRVGVRLVGSKAKREKERAKKAAREIFAPLFRRLSYTRGGGLQVRETATEELECRCTCLVSLQGSNQLVEGGWQQAKTREEMYNTAAQDLQETIQSFAQEHQIPNLYSCA